LTGLMKNNSSRYEITDGPFDNLEVAMVAVSTIHSIILPPKRFPR
jgi:hypothetical protein